MKKVTCDVIRDLLPLYVDDAANQETRALVQEHLNTCPACRDELQMMRDRISLPPDEGDELWAKFLQRREEQRRKKRKILIGTGAVLAVILLLCLWYTRPQKLTNVLGGREPVNLAALFSDPTPIFDEYGRVVSSVGTWLLNGVEAGDAALDEIWSILEGASCWASLRSLIPRSQYRTNGGADVILGFVSEDQDYHSFHFHSNGELLIGSGIGWDIYHIDPAVFDALAAVIQKYGEPS